MHEFHGELLLGGVRLRELDGEIDDAPCGFDEEWSGRFRIDAAKREWLELGRPYLLKLDDGRSSQVKVTQLTDDDTAILVQFGPA